MATSGTQPNMPFTYNTPITAAVPPIPQPSPRIGSFNLQYGQKSTMYLRDDIKKERDDKQGVDLKTHQPIMKSGSDASELLDPLLHRLQTADSTTKPKLHLDEQVPRTINRETALVRAMTAAGITHTLTKNCSTGDFANCVCDRYT